MKRAEITIAGSIIGDGHAPFTIAEVGINHNGDINLAKRMIDIAKEAGVSAVKFQTFKAEEFCGDTQQMFTYKSQGIFVTEPMLEMFRRYEFKKSDWYEIKNYCNLKGITFLSTPQNCSDLDLLLEIGISAIKIGSDDFTNLPLLKRYSETGLPIILSCGMADLGEIYTSLDAVGALDGYPVGLLLCTSQYPTVPGDVNLNKLVTLRSSFPMVVLGFSDHTVGPLASSLAVARGACIFEKHFTTNHDLPGPDHWFSEEPQDLKVWTSQILLAHDLLGSAIVRPTISELNSRKEFRRVIVAATDISKGDFFDESNLTMRRVGGGLGAPSSMYYNIIGKSAFRDYSKGEPIQI